MKYITAAEAAKLYGLNRHYAARLAKKAASNQEAKWPVKKGRTWIAPVAEWEKILNPKGVHIRKKRKKEILVKEKKSKETLISASEAGRKLGVSKSWASVLAKRSQKKGYKWPQKVGNMWLAPLNEWENIFQKIEK
jgi:hypothetical protein